MVEYKCKKCKKNFSQKCDYDKHCNRKTSCVSGSKTKKNDSYLCPYCDKSFSRKFCMVRHCGICKQNVSNTQIKGHHNSSASTTGKKNNAIGGNNNNLANKKAIIGDHNTVTHNENKYYFFFGKDGVKSMSHDEIINMLKSDKNLIESLISGVNLDPKKPKHHNVYYGDTKSTYGEVYDEDNKWVKMKIDEILNTLMDAKIEDLNDILKNMDGVMNKATRNKIKNAIERFDNTKVSARKKLISYLKPILFNHRDMILKTRKKYYDDIDNKKTNKSKK